MVYLGLLAYCVLLYIRPMDWVAGVLNWPLEFGVVGATTVIGIMRGRAGNTEPFPIHVPFLILWVAAIFLSNAVHGNLSAGIDFALRYVKMVIIFIMFWLVLDSSAKLRGVIVLLVFLTALLGLQGIYQVRHGTGWAGQPLYWLGRIRWVGLWDGANVLSLVFLTAMPFVLEMIFGPWRLTSKIFAVGSGGLILIGLYLANSRGAWLALAIVFLVYFRSRLGTWGIIVGTAAIALLFALGPSRLSEIDPDEKSAHGRIEMWSEGLEMIKYNPLLGIGKGQFMNYTSRLIAHNTFVQNMGETGLIGLFLWISLIYVSFKCLAVGRSHEKDIGISLQSMGRAVFVSLIGYLAASFFITTDFELLYILMALSAVLLTLARKESGKDLPLQFGPADLRNIALIELVGIVLIYVVT